MLHAFKALHFSCLMIYNNNNDYKEIYTVEMKAPKRTLTFYNRLSIWVALLFISFGLSMQSLQINLFEQATLDKEYAEAMAQQMAHGLRIKLSETQLQQKNAARHAATIDYLENENLDWKRTLKSLITGAEQIFILDSVSALGLQDKLGYAVQELATSTLKGKEFPLEAVQRDGEIHFYLATPIKDYTQTIKGILLIEYGTDWLDQLRLGAAAKHGLISTRQVLRDNPKQGLQVFEIGVQSASQLTVVTVSINDYWFLTFTPADTRPQLASTTIITPWIVALLGTLLTLLLITWLQTREIKRNKLKLLNYVRQMFRQGQSEWPKFDLKIFHEMGKAMEHLANSKGVLDKNDDPSSDLPISREKQQVELQPPTPPKVAVSTPPSVSSLDTLPQVMVEEEKHTSDVSQEIFRAFDIRGTVSENLTVDIAELIGLALGSELKSRDQNSIILAQDGRLSSPELAQAIQQGLLESGCDVINIGAVTTGTLYFACHELESQNGIMVTGSHNDSDINGFKIILDNQTLANERLMALYHRIQRQDFQQGQGQVTEQTINAKYLDRIQGDIQLSRPLKIVLDGANGIAGPIGLQLLKTMGLDVIPLYCNVDGHFPNHKPDPSDANNLSALQAAVVEHKADIGIAYDGDGDRLAVVDELGNIIMPDHLLMYLAKDVISRHPGCDVVYDVKSSRLLNSVITQSGGRPTMWKTGHSVMKAKMEELNASLGGELSGHFYFRDRWYGFDDALYASARLLELISQQFESVSKIFESFPYDISSEEISIDVDNQSKLELIDKLASEPNLQQGARVSTIDGIRSDFDDGWGLIRAANSSAKITLRFAGKDQVALERIKHLYKAVLNIHAPKMKIPF